MSSPVHPDPERSHPSTEKSRPSAEAPLPDVETRLRQALTDLGVGEGCREDLVAASVACAAVDAGVPAIDGPRGVTDGAPATQSRARANQLLTAIEAVTTLGSRMDGVRVAATRQLCGQMGGLLLADKGLSDPDEMSKTAREKWRARAKSVVRHEIEGALGWSAGDVITLVGLANAPAAVRGPVHQALARGEVSWPLVRAYFRATSAMAHEHGAAIANGLFGDDPTEAVTERLSSDGAWVGGPWRVKEFYRALDREVERVKRQEPQEEKKAAEAARAAADVRVLLDAEGTAEILIGCRPAQATAVADRIERAARAARKAGDKRSLRQLRSAVAVSLLLHGTVDFSGISNDPDTLTAEQSHQLTKLLHGLPTADLNVAVPLAAFGGTGDVLNSFNGPPVGRSGDDHPGSSGDGPPASAGDGLAVSSGDGPFGSRGTGGVDGAPAGGRSGGPPDATAVGEVVGRHPTFLGPADLWELMLTPGSVLHRLVIDPVSGRCVERSAKGYRFTAAQRDQIMAADVFCRGPGCLRPAWLCQIDHVQEFGTPGGETSEANAQSVSNPHHDLKTKKLWDAVINEQRDVTWTTLLGRIYTTKAHDYGQYTKRLHAATAFVDAAEGPDTTGGVAVDLSDRDVRVDAVIYDALSSRPVGAPLVVDDDWDESDEAFQGWPMITLTHRDASGRRVYRPDPTRLTTGRDAPKTTDDSGDGSGGTSQTTAGDDLLAGIDVRQAIDLTALDEPDQAGEADQATEPDPFGPARYLPWSDDPTGNEPPF